MLWAMANGAQAAGDAAHNHWMAPATAANRPNPVSADQASIERGKKLYEANCASCHGAGGRGDGPAGKALRPRPADLVQMGPGHSDGDFAWKIAEGRGPMPPWKAVLDETQIWDVVNYIKRGFGKK
jgi:mono/diheme cytochrome c family protein